MAVTEFLDQSTRKRRILAHLAQSRRARQSSRFDDKSAAAQARIQRRLSAQRQQTATHQTSGVGADRFTAESRKARPSATDAQGTPPEAEEGGEAASIGQRSDFLAQLRKLGLGNSLTAPNPEGIAQATAARRTVGIQNPATTFTGQEQNEITRLHARAKAEAQRADLVSALLEDVLNASTARILKHQARLEAMQAQINSLHGR